MNGESNNYSGWFFGCFKHLSFCKYVFLPLDEKLSFVFTLLITVTESKERFVFNSSQVELVFQMRIYAILQNMLTANTQTRKHHAQLNNQNLHNSFLFLSLLSLTSSNHWESCKPRKVRTFSCNYYEITTPIIFTPLSRLHWNHKCCVLTACLAHCNSSS